MFTCTDTESKVRAFGAQQQALSSRQNWAQHLLFKLEDLKKKKEKK